MTPPYSKTNSLGELKFRNLPAGLYRVVEGVMYHIIPSREETFTWNVITEFGSITKIWNRATIVDQIEPILEVLDYALVDENDEIVDPSTYTYELDENNKLTLTLLPVDESFGYLSGKTYKLSIETKIKDSATMEEIVAYTKEGGIPNEATLEFKNDSTVTSEIPLVDVPNDEEIILSGKKTWDHGNNNKISYPKSITVHILSNGSVLETRTVTRDDNWSWSAILPKYDADGKEIIYISYLCGI